jgi:hypothetical protein
VSVGGGVALAVDDTELVSTLLSAVAFGTVAVGVELGVMVRVRVAVEVGDEVGLPVAEAVGVALAVAVAVGGSSVAVELGSAAMAVGETGIAGMLVGLASGVSSKV